MKLWYGWLIRAINLVIVMWALHVIRTVYMVVGQPKIVIWMINLMNDPREMSVER